MEFKVIEIANFLNGEVVGDENTTVNSVSKIEEGKPGTLAFLSNLKYENYIYSTKASVVLVNKSFVPRNKIEATLIKVDDAYQAFASLLELYVRARQQIKTGIEQPSFMHESVSVGSDFYLGAFAYVGGMTKIGNNTKVYPQVYIGENVKIGNDCIIYAGVKIYSDTVIGDRCVIHSGAVIGSDGFGFAPHSDGTYKKIPQIGNAVLEDDVEIGANTTVDCGTMESTIVKKGVKLDNLVQVAHNCQIGENTVVAAQSGIAGSSKVGKNCRLGGQSGISGHITIGDNVSVGGQAGVMKSVEGNQAVFGSPAFNLKESIRAMQVFKDLPKLHAKVIELQKEVKSIKESK